MNAAAFGVFVAGIAAVVPIVVVVITRFSARRIDRSTVAATDANRDKSFQEIARNAANDAEDLRLRIAEIRRTARRMMVWVEDVCLPIVDQTRPDIADRARADIAELDELL